MCEDNHSLDFIVLILASTSNIESLRKSWLKYSSRDCELPDLLSSISVYWRMSHLLRLSTELLFAIFSYLPPPALKSLIYCCQRLHNTALPLLYGSVFFWGSKDLGSFKSEEEHDIFNGRETSHQEEQESGTLLHLLRPTGPRLVCRIA